MSPRDDPGLADGDWPAGPAALTVDVAGFEGPLDLLLTLARRQQVDLRRISVSALAEQYLAFVRGAEARQIALAAEYLVMAAWLAFLKSRLMLPAETLEAEPDAEEMAARLAQRLARLDAMRAAGEALLARPRLGRERLARGAPEALEAPPRVRWRGRLPDLLRAYARIRTADGYRPLALERPPHLPVERAAEALRESLGGVPGGAPLRDRLPARWRAGAGARSGLASGLAAALELARDGAVEIRQDAPFRPVELRAPVEPAP